MWRENWASGASEHSTEPFEWTADFGLTPRYRPISFFDKTSNFTPTNLENFPTTRFYGSKRRQLDWLHSEFRNLGVAGTALDAFGGTGSVTHLLRSLGWHVTFNDIFEFNLVSARALFSHRLSSITDKDISDLLKSVIPFDGFITANFENLFFTREENRWLDGFMKAISKRHKLNLFLCSPN